MPSCSSCAARSAIWLRSQGMLRPPQAAGLRTVRCSMRFSCCALDDPVHVDAGQVDVVGIEAARLHDLLHLHDADLAAHRGGRVEVARCLAEDQVAGRVRLPRLHDGQVRHDPALEDVGLPVELLVLLALGHDRADARLRVEARDARAAGAHPLGQRALRVELELEFARQVLPHELGVLAHVGGHHLPDLPGLEQHARARSRRRRRCSRRR